jgi:hypothetical protein
MKRSEFENRINHHIVSAWLNLLTNILLFIEAISKTPDHYHFDPILKGEKSCFCLQLLRRNSSLRLELQQKLLLRPFLKIIVEQQQYHLY